MEILHDNYDSCHVVTQPAFPVATPRFQSLSFTLLYEEVGMFADILHSFIKE